TAYLLSNTIIMPFLVKASNIFGCTVILWACLESFILETLLCYVITGIILLLVGRTFQGIGRVGIIVLSLVIFINIIPLCFRPK
ncbi:hypothetical protein F5883DRAFT_431580, partial [Diaporthe sp. PMI_573]